MTDKPTPITEDARPVRVRLRRTKGWRMPANSVSVARPGKFGNPWTVAAAIDIGYRAAFAPALCVGYYREWLTGSERSATRMLEDSDYLRGRIIEGLPELRGKNLACWCALDQPCHADVLLEIANAD